MLSVCGGSFFYFPTRWYEICEIESTHMGNSSRKLGLVYKKNYSKISWGTSLIIVSVVAQFVPATFIKTGV